MLRVGIIGSHFGAIGLLPAFDSVHACRVVAICGKRDWLTKRREHNDLRVYTDWQAMLRTEKLDAVAIATPPRAQYKIAKAAMQKGLHVFAEKPMARNVREARELLALARKKRVVHGIDFIFPEIAEWQKVKRMLDKKMLGRLQHISVDWDWQSGDIAHGRRTWKTNVKEGGGVLSFYFSHGLHYLEHFAGKIRVTKVVFSHSPKSLNGGEVGVDMLLKFRNGATGNVHVSCNSPGLIRHRIMFLCERGTIVLEGNDTIVDAFTTRVYGKTGERSVKIKKDAGRKNEDERVKVVRKLALRFVRACVRGTAMTPSFADGLRVQELIEAVRKNAGYERTARNPTIGTVRKGRMARAA